MVNSNEHLFLDTSTQINRHWSDQETNQKVRTDLFGKKLRCSIYVEREYRCKILYSLIYVHILVKQSKNIEEADYRLENLKNDIEELIYKIGKRLFRKYNSRKPVLKRLEMLIEFGWENYFYDGFSASTLCDMTNCTRGTETPKKSEQGYYFPIRRECPDNCNICNFWKSKQADLKNLAQIDTNKFNQFNDPKASMGKIQNEAQAILGGKSPHGDPCRTVSDAIISVEARDSYPGITIHTMDYDFDHLKDILNTQVRLFKVYKTA